jgi:hypothetical protein
LCAYDDAITRISDNIRVRVDFERDCRVSVGGSRWMQLQPARVGDQLNESIRYRQNLLTI